MVVACVGVALMVVPGMVMACMGRVVVVVPMIARTFRAVRVDVRRTVIVPFMALVAVIASTGSAVSMDMRLSFVRMVSGTFRAVFVDVRRTVIVPFMALVVMAVIARALGPVGMHVRCFGRGSLFLPGVPVVFAPAA